MMSLQFSNNSLHGYVCEYIDTYKLCTKFSYFHTFIGVSSFDMHVCKIGFVEWRHLEQLSITLIEDSTLDHL